MVPGADVGPCPAYNGSHVWRPLDRNDPPFCCRCGAMAGASYAVCSGRGGPAHDWVESPSEAAEPVDEELAE
jgi:hypothetical protein